MVDSIPNGKDGSRDGEGTITSFAAATVAALCCSLKEIDMSARKLKSLLPLLITAISQCPSDAHNLLLDLFNGIYDLAVSVGGERFFRKQSRISTVMDPLMENLPVNHPLFCSFLSSFEKFCRFLDDDAMSLKRSLTKMCIKALRFPLNDDGTEESERVKKAKRDSWDFISEIIRNPNYFKTISEELVKVVLELIESENEIEKLKITLYKLIDEDRDRELTSLCIRQVAECIDSIKIETLAKTEVDEIGLMVKNQLEKETRRRDKESRNEVNARIEEPEGLLNRSISILNYLLKKKVPICNILYPIIPIIFPLIEKCTNKLWGVRFITVLLAYVPEFTLEFRDLFIPLLFDSLNKDEPSIRRLAANSFGQMADSNISELKEIALSSLDDICRLMDRPDARLEGHRLATEDAIAAILIRFLSWFPLWGEGESKECEVIYTFLLDLIDMNHPLIMDEINSTSPRLLFILTKAIHDEVFTQNTSEINERLEYTIKLIACSCDSIDEWIRRSGLIGDELATLTRILTSTN